MIYKEIDDNGDLKYRSVDLSELNLSELLTLKKKLELSGEDGSRMIDAILYEEVNYDRLLGNIRREERTNNKIKFNDPKAFVKKRKKLHKR